MDKKAVCLVLTLPFLLLSLDLSNASDMKDSGEDHTSNTLAFGRSTSQDKEESSSLRGINHLLAHYNPRAAMTCNNFPRICRAKGSPGPDCCKRRCVNVMKDGLNCGQCGKKCKYGEACCGGSCVNVMYDRENCGGCRKRCRKGSYCRYGMCSYA